MKVQRILTDSEKERIRQAIREGMSHKKVAVELRLPQRKVLEYYQQFRGYPVVGAKPLSADEKEFIRRAYDANDCPKRVAAILGRAVKTVRAHYKGLRGFPARPYHGKKDVWVRAERAEPVKVEDAKPVVKSRFYHSDFIPS